MEPEYRHNLLSEVVFRVERPDGSRANLSLPEVLQNLGAQKIESFCALRPHQQHAWHAFLVQLAAMALHKAGETKIEQSAARWRDLLLAMSDGEEAAWCLVVDDLSQPAFMQPPVPEGKISKKWNIFATPASVDLLVTAKNHDVKGQLIERAVPEHWVYALMSLQTSEGYGGRGQNGIARMNSGLGSRTGMSLVADPTPAARFVRDTRLLLDRRSDLLKTPWSFKAENGVGLLWLLPWDGETSLQIEALDPYFIEICRRIRLRPADQYSGEQRLLAMAISTQKSRIEAKELRGLTGDPWNPITNDSKGAKVLTITASGFDYKMTSKLLFSGEYKHAIAWQDPAEKGDLTFIAAGLTRGQGKTEGLHQRRLKIPAKVSLLTSKAEGQAKLAKRTEQYIALVDEVRRTVLHRALCVVTQGAPDGKLDFRDKSDQAWLDAFERDVDSIFFERLFAQVDMEAQQAENDWTRELLDLAEKQLDDALRSLPQPSIRRYRIDAAARGMFHGMARKTFSDLFQNDNDAALSPETTAPENVFPDATTSEAATKNKPVQAELF